MKFLFYFVFFATLILRLLPANLQNMPFTMDQGRDLVDVRQIWEGRDLRLIGPTTSLNGLHLGPFYYYLISIPYLLSSGDPRSVLVWQILCFHLAVIYFWKTFKKHNLTFANLTGILLLISPVSFYTNRYFWNANFMPALSIIYITLLANIHLSKSDPKKDYWLGLVAGLSLQVEAAFGILFLPFSLLFYFVTKSTIPRFARFLTSFFVTLIPQLVFEFAKYFPMTKVVLNELSGSTNTLGQKLSLFERFLQRKESFLIALNQSSHINPSILFYLLIICLLIFIFYRKNNTDNVSRSVSTTSFYFLIFTFVFYIFYPSTLKSWYTFSLSIFFAIFIGSNLSLLNQTKLFTKIIFAVVLLASFLSVYQSQKEYLTNPAYQHPNNPSAYANQVKVIDDIYKFMEGKSFYVYNYLPSVYDYPFQYLFWFHGLKKYGYSPNDLAYLPNQPEYIKNKNSFLQKTKTANSQTPTVLIIQEGDNKSHLQGWLGNFAHLCRQNQQEYFFSQKVIYLTPCIAK